MNCKDNWCDLSEGNIIPRQQLVDYWDTSCHADGVAIAATNNLSIHEFDVQTAFLNGELKDSSFT